MKVKKNAINYEEAPTLITSTMKSINNLICAYRDCRLKGEIRLYFPLGFSALFCNNCASLLIDGNLAKESEVEVTKS